jgi:hypothetical protein
MTVATPTERPSATNASAINSGSVGCDARCHSSESSV